MERAGSRAPVVPSHIVCPVGAGKARGCLFSVLNYGKFFEAQEARERELSWLLMANETSLARSRIKSKTVTALKSLQSGGRGNRSPGQ